MSSSARVNYKLRPAKAVERKMLCEAFRHLRPLARPDSFRYVGLGSLFFSDFILFHRALNIGKMVSIEQDTNRAARYKFNLPYKCVELKTGHTNKILPDLKWEGIPSIVWLDYDGELTTIELNDVQIVCDNVQPPSIFLLTANAHPGELRENDQTRLERLREAVGANRIPSGTEEKHLAKWGKADVLRNIIDDEIRLHIGNRNGRIDDPNQKVVYDQLFYFHYADNAQMVTVGGILYHESDRNKVEDCDFASLDWYRPDNQPYEIQVPILTVKELKHLDLLLPKGSAQMPKIEWLDKGDTSAEDYQRIYRFFPTFTEAADL